VASGVSSELHHKQQKQKKAYQRYTTVLHGLRILHCMWPIERRREVELADPG